MTTTHSLAVVRERLSPLVLAVETTHERVVITKNGVPVAVLLAGAYLESLLDTVEILSDPGVMEDLRRGDEEEKFSLAQIEAELSARSDDSAAV